MHNTLRCSFTWQMEVVQREGLARPTIEHGNIEWPEICVPGPSEEQPSCTACVVGAGLVCEVQAHVFRDSDSNTCRDRSVIVGLLDHSGHKQ